MGYCSQFVFLLITIDITGDYRDGVPWTHLLTEMLILMLSLSGVVYFGWLYYHFAQAKISFLTQNLALANQQAQQWREANRELIAGLAVQIQKQFDAWQLTPAEAEVGLLMLKGLSHGEIAHVRNASERESLFLRKLVLGIPAQASGKNLTRPPMPAAAPAVLLPSSYTRQGV